MTHKQFMRKAMLAICTLLVIQIGRSRGAGQAREMVQRLADAFDTVEDGEDNQ